MEKTACRRSIVTRVVVVDDDADLLASLCAMLRKHGFHVAGFTDPRSALAAHNGGRLIACGTPEAIAACKASHTGRFLADVLRR